MTICDVLREVWQFGAALVVEVDWVDWGRRTLEFSGPNAIHDLVTHLMAEPAIFGGPFETATTVSLREAESRFSAFFSGLPEFDLPIGVGRLLNCDGREYSMETVYFVWRACHKSSEAQ